MSSTYSSRPFISHDGPDENGVRAEIQVVTGYGHVFEIEESEKGNAKKVVFKVENTKYKSTGWAPVDDPVIALVEEAEKNGEPIHFRIEQRRKDTVPRNIPIKELKDTADKARDNTYKSLTAVKREDDTEWTISPKAQTNMAEDPKSGSYSANDYNAEELRAMSNKGSQPAKTWSSIFEAPPYADFNNDGTVNMGSLSVAVPTNIYAFINEYVRDNELEIDERRKLKIVKVILQMCNRAQVEIYDGSITEPVLSAGSHTRARALVFESIKSYYPITEEIANDNDLLKDWGEKTYEKVVGMWRWSYNEVKDFLKK